MTFKLVSFVWHKALPILAAAIAVFWASLWLGCGCGDGSVCGSGNTVVTSPDALPTPPGQPTVLPTPDPCRIEAVRLGFNGGKQVPVLALGSSEQLDVTPLNSSGPVADGCNIVRDPVFNVLTPTTCQVVGSGFNPFLRGLRVGGCLVTATVSNVISAPLSVEVR